jgi:nitrogen fixation protein FixH
VDLPAGKDVGGVRITLVPMAEVRVTVRDRAGKPVYHGVVRATREMATSREERTDADGRATLEVIPGPWTIRVFARDGKGAPLGAREIEVRRSGPNEVSLFVPRSGR